MENDLVFTRPAGNLTLTIRMRWLAQDRVPDAEALDWAPDVDYVALATAVEAEDADGVRVLPGYWGVQVPAGWERYANGVTRRDRGVDAQALENAARTAVSDLVVAIEQARTSRAARHELRRQRREAAGVPTWLRSADSPPRDKEKPRARG